MRIRLASVLLLVCSHLYAVDFKGSSVQGGLIFGQATAGSSLTLDGENVAISSQGQFVIGFGRDETGVRHLRVVSADGEVFQKDLTVEKREYAIERVDGLPPKTVTPDPSASARIKEDGRMVTSARQHRENQAFYASGFE